MTELKVVALIDGEHYPPVVKHALEKLSAEPGQRLVGAVFIGGIEKIRTDAAMPDYGVELVTGQDMIDALTSGLDRFRPDMVVDLSDEPVIGYMERYELACHILHRGASYRGPDFHFEPPIFKDIVQKPSISIIGTGKRTGKTAVSAYACRVLKTRNHSPAVVAMGRGGPETPEVLHGESIDMTPEFLMEMSRSGKHAASDYFEDALMSRVTTVGCRRCGGGMAGRVFVSNVEEGARIANGLDEDLIVFEGSGAAIPPVKTSATILIAGAGQPEEYIGGYFGPYRIMLSDAVVLTMCEPPMADREKTDEMEAAVKRVDPDIPVIRTVFRPKPLEPVDGRNVFVATTAPAVAGNSIRRHLEEAYGCTVTGISHNLSDRPELEKDLQGASYDTLLVELKAAAVDVATERAETGGHRVVYMDNEPVTVGGKALDEVIIQIAAMARNRFHGDMK